MARTVDTEVWLDYARSYLLALTVSGGGNAASIGKSTTEENHHLPRPKKS
jgi:hypothetical protein